MEKHVGEGLPPTRTAEVCGRPTTLRVCCSGMSAAPARDSTVEWALLLIFLLLLGLIAHSYF